MMAPAALNICLGVAVKETWSLVSRDRDKGFLRGPRDVYILQNTHTKHRTFTLWPEQMDTHCPLSTLLIAAVFWVHILTLPEPWLLDSNSQTSLRARCPGASPQVSGWTSTRSQRQGRKVLGSCWLLAHGTGSAQNEALPPPVSDVRQLGGNSGWGLKSSPVGAGKGTPLLGVPTSWSKSWWAGV